MTTHAWMAESAIDLVDDPGLAALLNAHVDQVRAGARFPDGGYGPGNVYGEEAHWQRFFDVYADLIAAKDCGDDLADPDGPCAEQIAHFLGMIGHGTGDEVWDWLFEPNSPDLDEYYSHPDFGGFDDPGGQEMLMDLVAIGVHDRPGGNPPPLPSIDDLLEAFEISGQAGVTAEQLQNGQLFIGVAYQAEQIWAEAHLDAVLEAMPWMSANLITAPGGVDYAAQAIAGQWNWMWEWLNGGDPTTEVSITYPADGQDDIPSTGWVRSYQPGSHPGRGGARTRISASLTYATPYLPPPGTGPGLPSELPEGSMTITERDTGEALPLLAGYPKVVPYGANAGTHTIDVQPATDLEPCTWYRVDVTAALLDARNEPVAPHSWEFRTAPEDEGTDCPPDEVDPLVDYVERAYRDVLGRAADTAGRDHWVTALEGGMSTQTFARHLVASAEHRRVLVDAIYRGDLGRAPEPAALTYWEDRIRLTSVDTVRAQVLGSAEALARAGGTTEAWVDLLYRSALGRPVDDAGLAYWGGLVDGGSSRPRVAQRVLATTEAVTATARAALTALLDRDPTPTELTTSVAIVRTGDVRTLVIQVVGSPPYAPDPPLD